MMGFINPRSVAPSISLAVLQVERMANYLVVFDDVLSPNTPFHYFPLKVTSNKGSTTSRIVHYPNVIAPGIVILKGGKVYTVGISDLQRGKLTEDMRIKDVKSYLSQVNNVSSENSEVGKEDDGTNSGNPTTADVSTSVSGENSDSTGNLNSGGVEGSPETPSSAIFDLPNVEQEDLLSNIQNTEGFRFFR